MRCLLAKGFKTGGRNFEPGNTLGKLGGRPPVSPEIKAARKIDGKIFAQFWNMEDQGFRIVNKVFEMALEGNLAAAQVIFDRVLGKVSDKIQHTASKPTLMRLLDKDGLLSGESLLFGRQSED